MDKESVKNTIEELRLLSLNWLRRGRHIILIARL